MNIIIPIGGVGQRFLDTGFKLPKPLINLLLKPIIFWLLDSLNIRSDDRVVIICNKRLHKYRFKQLVDKSYDNITTIYLDKDTRGAAETVLQGLEAVDPDLPTLLLDGDTFYNIDIINKYRSNTNKNVVFSFEQQDDRPIYSYVQVVNGVVRQIAEKNPISNLANTGAYAFAKASTLKQYCESALNRFDQLEQNELYTSSIISDMIKDNHEFSCIKLKENDFEVVGTPLQFKLFQNNHKTNKTYFANFRICFDLDNTLVTHPVKQGDYTTVAPIEQNIKYAQLLKNLGCTVIIYTARRMKTHKGNVGAIMTDVGKITLDTISEYEIPCDELYFGKPYAHAYIDDLAYNAFDDYTFQLGLTDHHVKERDFNTVSSKMLQVFEKKSLNIDKLKAEVFWYKNIPENVKKYTPRVLSDEIESDGYLMEKIDGITFSELLVSQSLSESIFQKLLDCMKNFHINRPTTSDVDMYCVYNDKIKKRYEQYNYSIFPNAEELYDKITKQLDIYINLDLGKLGCIHGDPVFSNVLVDKDSSIKLVDPRGQTSNNSFCIYGDIMYDYAKILQSLCGYDEIMLTGEHFLDNTSMIDMLFNHVSSLYGSEYIEHIKIIKNSLLFTLIPLHDNKNCNKYYQLIDK